MVGQLTLLMVLLGIFEAFGSSLETVDQKIKKMIETYQQSVFIQGEPQLRAMNTFVKALENSGITLAEIKDSSYISKHHDRITETFKSMVDQPPKKWQHLLVETLSSESKAGASFIGCKAGLMTGLPLVMLSIVSGVIAIADAHPYWKGLLDLRRNYKRERQEIKDSYAPMFQEIEEYFEPGSHWYNHHMAIWNDELSKDLNELKDRYYNGHTVGNHHIISEKNKLKNQYRNGQIGNRKNAHRMGAIALGSGVVGGLLTSKGVAKCTYREL
jgi:hypothetical protein